MFLRYAYSSAVARSRILLCVVYKRAYPRLPAVPLSTMQNDDEVVNTTDVATSLSKKCDICCRLGPEESKLLTEYVVKLTKDHTLSSMIQEISSFVANLHQRQADKPHDRLVPTGVHPQVHTDDAIVRHVMSCIAPREATVRMLICNSVLMDMLNNATCPQDTGIAVKLLLQTQAAEKKI